MVVGRLTGTLCCSISDRNVIVIMTVLVVMVMLVVMMVFVGVAAVAIVFMHLGGFFPFYLPVDGDGDMTAGNAALLILPDREDGSAAKCAVQGVQNRFGLLMQFQQSSGQHVAGSAHAAIQIKCFHRFNTSFILPVR